MRLTVLQLLFALLTLMLGSGQALAVEPSRAASASPELRVALPKAFKAALGKERKACVQPCDHSHASPQSPTQPSSMDDSAAMIPAPIADPFSQAPGQAPPEWLLSAYVDPLPRELQRPPCAVLL